MCNERDLTSGWTIVPGNRKYRGNTGTPRSKTLRMSQEHRDIMHLRGWESEKVNWKDSCHQSSQHGRDKAAGSRAVHDFIGTRRPTLPLDWKGGLDLRDARKGRVITTTQWDGLTLLRQIHADTGLEEGRLSKIHDDACSPFYSPISNQPHRRAALKSKEMKIPYRTPLSSLLAD